MNDDKMSFVVSAGHDEYGPQEVPGLTVEDYTIEVLRAAISGDFEGEVPDWKDAVVEGTIVSINGGDYDLMFESFYWWSGSREAVEAGLESLMKEVSNGPYGADDDTFDYWPSGVRYAQQVADQLSSTHRIKIDEAAKHAIMTKRPQFADELFNSCRLT